MPQRPLAAGIPRRRGTEPWSDGVPIRSVLFSPERLAEHAASLADEHLVVRRPPRVVSLLERLRKDSAAISAVHRQLSADIEQGRAVTPAAEWLVDNMHVVERQVGQIRQDLPPSYFAELPKLGSGFLAGHPRIFALMWAYIAHSDSLVDPSLLAGFIRAYERRKALTIGELWAVSTTLRFLLLENLRRQSEVLASSARQRRLADDVADRWLGLDAIADRRAVTPGDGVEISSRAFAVQLMRRLAGAAPVDTSGWLRDQIRAAGLDPEEITHEEHQAQAASSITMRNIFTSLRVIGDVDWGSWFEGVSLIEQELRRSPGYRALDFPTRNFYREAVEDLARGSGQGEIDVARAALARARRSTDDLHTDVGYWLVDDGRADLASALSFRPSARQRAAEVARRTGVWGYVASQLVVNAFLSATAATLVWAAVQSGGPSMGDHRIPGLPTWAPPTWVLLVALAALLPLSDLAIAIVNRRASVIFPARPLPRLSLTGGVPEDLRTLIAVPTLLDSPETVDQLVAVLEVHHLANRDGELYVALVTDWTTTTPRTEPTTRPCWHAPWLVSSDSTRPTRVIASCSSTEGAGGTPAEGVWMGWERKRGKLEQLNAAARAADGDDIDARLAAAVLPGRPLRADARQRHPAAAGAAERLVGTPAIRSTDRASTRAVGAVSDGYGDPAAARDADAAGARPRHALPPAVLRPSRASTRTPSPSPTSTRTSSARARSPARASTTSRPCRRGAGGRLPENRS